MKKNDSEMAEKFKIVDSNFIAPPQIFCDGFQGMTLSPYNAKLDLFQVVNVEDGVEYRKITHTLVVPTVALAEMARSILDTIEKNSSGLREAISKNASQIFGDVEADKA